jgi:hypothetical protein
MKQNWRILVGALLLLFGVVGILQAFNIVSLQGEWWGLFFGVVFAVAGGIFLYYMIKNTSLNWWAAIPGMSLLGIGLTILSSVILLPPLNGYLGGVLVLGSIGASFWIIYFIKKERWWAIIPGGVMITLAGITLLEESSGMDVPGILFLGIGITFALIALLPTGRNEAKVWPWYPAVGCLVLGMILSLTGGSVVTYIWPAVLIILGLVLIARTYLKRNKTN